MNRRFSIIGAGMGQPESLTGQARAALENADIALSTERLAQNLSAIRPVEACAMGEMAARAISSNTAHAAILVSGDTGFFSAARTLCDALAPFGAVEMYCGQSSMQYLCARLGTSYDDVYFLSLHGRQGSILGPVSFHKKVFALTGGAWSASGLCAELARAGLGDARAVIGENLGAGDERILSGTAAELAQVSCGSLAVLLVENEHASEPYQPVFDRDMTRGDVPMTKQEVRWVAASMLSVKPHDIVYDIGAGTGSVSMELARRAPDGMVYAIERKPEGLALIEQNRVALGCYNVIPVAGLAPDALEALPTPDAVFIGGSGGELPEILSMLRARNPHVRVVVSAIAVETLALAQQTMKEQGFEDLEIVQLSAARGRKVGGYTLMTANNPVFLLAGGGNDEA